MFLNEFLKLTGYAVLGEKLNFCKERDKDDRAIYDTFSDLGIVSVPFLHFWESLNKLCMFSAFFRSKI